MAQNKEETFFISSKCDSKNFHDDWNISQNGKITAPYYLHRYVQLFVYGHNLLYTCPYCHQQGMMGRGWKGIVGLVYFIRKSWNFNEGPPSCRIHLKRTMLKHLCVHIHCACAIFHQVYATILTLVQRCQQCHRYTYVGTVHVGVGRGRGGPLMRSSKR